MDLAAMEAEFVRLSRNLDRGLTAMRTAAGELADAENEYRKAKSQAWVSCPNDPPSVKAGEREWTAARREAWVNAETADHRKTRDLAEGKRQAAIEAVRSRRTQISALQTLLNAHQAEASFARTEPGVKAA